MLKSEHDTDFQLRVQVGYTVDEFDGREVKWALGKFAAEGRGLDTGKVERHSFSRVESWAQQQTSVSFANSKPWAPIVRLHSA